MIEEKIFAEKVVRDIKSYLPSEYLDVNCEIVEMPKNNGVIFIGIIFRKPDEGIAPIIYIEPYYKDIKCGEPMHNVMKRIAASVHSGMQNRNILCEKDIMSYDAMKGYLSVKLINKKANQNEIMDMPCCDIEDLSLVPIIRFPVPNGNEYGTVKISNDILSNWGIETNELYQQIWKNMKNEIELFTLEEKLVELMTGCTQPPNLLSDTSRKIKNSDVLYLSTKIQTNGAAAVAYPGLLDKIGEMLPEGFYVIPSSIDEMLVVPKSIKLEVSELRELVKTVNHEIVDKKNILSNSIYQYDKERGCLCKVQEPIEKGRDNER